MSAGWEVRSCEGTRSSGKNWSATYASRQLHASEDLVSPRQRTLQAVEHEQLSLDQIRALAGDPDAVWVHPLKEACFVFVQRDEEPESLRVTRMLFVAGMYVVETDDEPDNWYMGEEGRDGLVRCWGNYGTPADAIRGL